MILVKYQNYIVSLKNIFLYLVIYFTLMGLYIYISEHLTYLILVSLISASIVSRLNVKIYLKNSFIDSKYTQLFRNKKAGYFFCLLLIFITFMYQLTTLNIEILNWDISTFLVMSGDILRGNIPYENQWEFKGPLFFYMYTIPQIFSPQNLIAVKIFNDIIFALTALTIFFITTRIKQDYLLALIASLSFVFLTSISRDGHPGFSEIYSLLFIGLAIYFYFSRKLKNNVFISGFFAACSLLITMSSLLFVAYFSLIQFLNSKNKTKNLTHYASGFVTPYAIIFIVYISKNLFYLNIFTNFIFPFSYVQNDADMGKLLRGIYYILTGDRSRSLLIHFMIFIIIFAFIKSLLSFLDNRYINYDVLLFLGLILISILVFGLAGTGYWHQIIYFLFFLSFSLLFIENTILKLFYSALIFSILSTTSLTALTTSYKNIKNVKQEQYSVYQEYRKINSLYNIETIFATRNHLILFYFDLPQNYYAVHPSLLYRSDHRYVMEMLKSNNLVKSIEIDEVIRLDHDLILCYPVELPKVCNEMKNSKNYILLESDLDSQIFVKKGLEK